MLTAESVYSLILQYDESRHYAGPVIAGTSAHHIVRRRLKDLPRMWSIHSKIHLMTFLAAKVSRV